MFKNRIRTATIAGATAVAATLSGIAVPAFAAESNIAAPTQNIDNGFNKADASKAVNAVSDNVTELALRNATDAVANYLNNEGTVNGVIARYVAYGENGIDPSEQQIENEFELARKAASAQLAATEKNIQDARNSVNYALEQDAAAAAAWKAYLDAQHEQALKDAASFALVSDAVKAVNEASKDANGAPKQIDLPTSVQSLDDLEATLKALQTRWYEATKQHADNNQNDYIVRYYLPALNKAIQITKDQIEAVKAGAAALKKLDDAAHLAQESAQNSDVLVRQLYLERAIAQRDLLRIVEAKFVLAERYVELYENPEDVNVNVSGQDLKLRAVYLSTITKLNAAHVKALNEYKAAEDDAFKNFLVWNTDLRDYTAASPELTEDQKYAVNKLEAGQRLFANVFEYGQWQNDVSFVETLDKNKQSELKDKIAADQAAAEAAKASAEKADQSQKTQEAILKALTSGTTPAVAATKDSSNVTAQAGSSNIQDKGGIFGIIAAIVGVLAALGAAFPFIANALNIKF